MVSLILGPMDLARTRFAFSPLWECVAAFRAWRRDQESADRRRRFPWASRVPNGDWELLRALALAPSGVIPDFLAPPPPSPLARFADEIEGLRATSADVIIAELRAAYGGSLPFALAVASRNVSQLVDELCAQLVAFWDAAIASFWPRIIECLESEVVYRSRVLAFQGTEAVFANLHPAVTFATTRAGAVLRIAARSTVRRRVAGMGVLLVPSMFAWPHVYVVSRQPWRPTVAYPARGVAALWESASERRDPSRGLELLVGAPRARVLRRLQRPHTTSDLAAALGMSSATISAHLGNLHGAGLLHRARAGRRVYYTLNDRGVRFLQLAGE